MHHSSQQFVGIDLADMAAGRGEWRNLQDVIRRSFRAVFDQIGMQQQEIGRLNEVLSVLCREERRGEGEERRSVTCL